MTDRLNPEALEAAAKALDPQIGQLAERFPDSLSLEANMERLRTEARAAVSAYLAALLPPRTITTVEGLEALPVGTVLRVARKELAEIGKSFGSKTLRATEWTEYLSDWGAEETEYLLPATVLHVPTEGGGE